jgi:hypothetical protein
MPGVLGHGYDVRERKRQRVEENSRCNRSQCHHDGNDRCRELSLCSRSLIFNTPAICFFGQPGWGDPNRWIAPPDQAFDGYDGDVIPAQRVQQFRSQIEKRSLRVEYV